VRHVADEIGVAVHDHALIGERAALPRLHRRAAGAERGGQQRRGEKTARGSVLHH